MASALRQGHDQVTIDQAKGSLLDACVRLYSSANFIAFAKTIFGEEDVKSGIEERKEELRHMGANGGHVEELICRQLMRAFVTLQDKLGETENAAELLKLAKGVYAHLRAGDCECPCWHVRDGGA